MPEYILGRMPEYMPHKMPHRRPNRMPDGMSECMPDDMSAGGDHSKRERERDIYIYIFVGILYWQDLSHERIYPMTQRFGVTERGYAMPEKSKRQFRLQKSDGCQMMLVESQQKSLASLGPWGTWGILLNILSDASECSQALVIEQVFSWLQNSDGPWQNFQTSWWKEMSCKR